MASWLNRLAHALGGASPAGDATASARGDAAAPAAPADPVATGALRFALDLWRAGTGGDPDGNACLGPLSASCALGMTALGAHGGTREEMLRTLGLPDEPPAHARLAALLRLPPQDGVTLLPANRLFLARAFAPRSEFLAAAAEAYQADAVQVDFDPDPEPGRKAINAWVAERTRDAIAELLQAGHVQRTTPLVLVNAVYLKAAWETPFPAAATAPAPFRLADGGRVEVPTMRLVESFPCAEVDGLRLVELPYRGGRLGALVLLPPPGGLRALEARLEPARLAGWVGALQERPVQLALPRFQVRQQHELDGVLPELGMRLAFTPQADFSRLARAPLMISKVVHEAFLKVDEEGSVAAAATAVVMAPGCAAPPPPFPMQVDRPFLLLIRDRASGALLFLARVSHPR